MGDRRDSLRQASFASIPSIPPFVGQCQPLYFASGNTQKAACIPATMDKLVLSFQALRRQIRLAGLNDSQPRQKKKRLSYSIEPRRGKMPFPRKRGEKQNNSSGFLQGIFFFSFNRSEHPPRRKKKVFGKTLKPYK